MAGRIAKFLLAGLSASAFFAANAAGATSFTPRLKPPAPGPAFLSRLDQAHLLTIHDALDRKQFAPAHAEIKLISDPTARALGQWFYYSAKDPNVDIAEGDAFLDAHPNWPSVERIQAHLESELTDTTPTDAILALFDSRPPRTGDGKIHFARALLSKGRSEEATAAIRDAWIHHNFTITEERKIIAAYKSRLRDEDHAARVDRLLWSRQVTNARRTFPFLASKDRRMAEARAALLLGAGIGPRLYRNLPKEEQLDSGVLHAAVRYYRRTDDDGKAISLAANAPDSADALRNTDRWWLERRLLLQTALKEGRPSDAYALAAHHGMKEGGDFADAEFVAGWIALRFLNAPERALTHFEAMTGAVGSPISLSRGYYWSGRALDAAGKTPEALGYYRSAAEFPYSYYGQLAAERLGGAPAAQKFAATESATQEDLARFNARPAVAALKMLSDLNLDYEFMVFAYHVDDELREPGEFLALARLTNGEGAPHLTVRAGKVAALQGSFAAEVSYPMVFVPDEARAFVKPEIILGLSRQESEFNPRAYSSAGARGVMQLIPSTAQLTARKEGLPYNRSALLDDPAYNMTIGSAHLSHLLDRFDGSLVMTFAGYNAGVHRAEQWARDFGDPRTNEVDPVDWVELIPFSETRNYVQRVLENTQVYRARLNDTAIPGGLGADIERGGPAGRIARTVPSQRIAALAQVNGDPGALADLPAQTALLAADFRAKRLADALSLQTPPTVAPGLDSASEAAPAEPPSPKSNRKRKRTPAKKPPLIKPTPAAAVDGAAAPMPEPAPGRIPELKAERTQTKTENTAAAAAGEQSQFAEPEFIAEALAPAKENQPDALPIVPTSGPSVSGDALQAHPEPAQEFIASPSQDPNPILAIDEETLQAATKIVDKAAKRLEIGDESDAIAAAVARGLEQLQAVDDAPATEIADPACSADNENSGAANLNAQMAAKLRGEDQTCVDRESEDPES